MSNNAHRVDKVPLKHLLHWACIGGSRSETEGNSEYTIRRRRCNGTERRIIYGNSGIPSPFSPCTGCSHGGSYYVDALMAL